MGLPRRALKAAAVAAAVIAAFGAGLVTGRDGAEPATPAAGSPSASSVVSEAAQRISAVAATPVELRRLDGAAITAMLAQLGDRYASYHDPADAERLRSLLAGRYGGLGLWLAGDADGRIVVSAVQPDTPAAAAGIQPQDRILSVAGTALAGIGVDAAAGLLRGQPGTPVSLRLARADAPPFTAALVRQQVATGDVMVTPLAPRVVELRIAAFTRGVGAAVRAAVDGWRARPPQDRPQAYVLDLRGNPGGLLDEAVDAAGGFLDGGPVVSYQGRGVIARQMVAPEHGDVTTPLAVLVDDRTASAAEALAGALQDRKRAVVVGQRTFGKGSVQEPIALSDGSTIELTVAHYATPSGRLLDGVGIEPDVVLAAGGTPSAAEQRAVDVLIGVTADVATGPRGKG